MTAPPIVRQFAAGEIETAAFLNSLGAVVNFLLNPPRARVYATAAQSLTTATYTPLLFQAEAWDTDGMHSTTTNTSRLTANTSGLYQFMGVCTFQGNATGRRLGSIFHNGAQPMTSDSLITYPLASAAIGSGVFVFNEFQMAAGDYAEFAAYQDSGVALNVLSTGNTNSWFAGRWVGVS